MGLQKTSSMPHGRPRTLEGGDQASARDLRALFGAVFGARADWPLDVKVRPDGLVIRLAGPVGASTWDLFGFLLLPGNVVRIRTRTIRIHQIANAVVQEQDVHLGGTPCWIYVSILRSTYGTSSVLTAASEPESNTGALNIPLYQFDFNSTTGKYALADAGHFDIHIDAPTR